MAQQSIDASFGAALKFPLHSISLILIYCYLILKILYEGFSDNNLRDEPIGGDCSCKANDRVFYQIIYWCSCGAWWICVFIVSIVHWVYVRLIYSFIIII